MQRKDFHVSGILKRAPGTTLLQATSLATQSFVFSGTQTSKLAANVRGLQTLKLMPMQSFQIVALRRCWNDYIILSRELTTIRRRTTMQSRQIPWRQYLREGSRKMSVSH